jgi:hypothetical protein
MKKYQLNLISILIFILMGISLKGCNSDDQINIVKSPTPTIFMKTPTREFTQTPAPIALLGQRYQTRIDFVKDLFTKDICKLPCLGEIYPGTTDFNDAARIYQIYGAERVDDYVNNSKGLIFDTVEINQENKRLWIGFETWYENGIEIIEYMDVMRFQYPIKTLLDTYGKPNSILVRIIEPWIGDNEAPLSLILDYNRSGMIFNYQMDVRAKDPIKLCSDLLTEPYIKMWNVDRDLSLTSVFFAYPELIGELNTYIANPSKLGFSVDEFYEAFTKAGSDKNCIDLHYPY